MQTLTEIRRVLEERGLRPRHRFGQNFLHDHQHLRRLIDAAGLEPGDVVLEIGPGTGALTDELVERGATVIACEIDRDLAEIVRDRFGDRIILIEGDGLERGRRLHPAIMAAIDDRPFRLVANLPYQAASPLMAALAIDHADCIGQFITVQREVADRLLAGPGSKAYGPLGIILQSLCTVERLGIVPATCFWPVPKVTSAMIALRPRDDVATEEPARFARFVTMLFSKRRKQLGAILGRDFTWPEGITPDRRPDALTIPQLVALHDVVPESWLTPPS